MEQDCEDFCGWFVVETHANKEQFAVCNLERQKFQTFFPRFAKIRRHARKTDTVLAPLFPGYLFIRGLGAEASARSVNGTFGVRRYVAGSGGRPAPMPASAMAGLLARCRDGIVERLFEPAPGTRVRILAGPLADCMATIERLDSRGRIKVLLELLGRDICLTLNHSAIGPI